MKATILYITLLAAFTAAAQNYQWQWAKSGGGVRQSPYEGNGAYGYDSEQVKDIVVDSENNYYFLTFMTQYDTQYDGSPVTVYNAENQNSAGLDIVLISTTCDGSLRWTQTIGGGNTDYSYKIALDNSGGLYLLAQVSNLSGPQPNAYLPPHFSPDDSLPVLDGTIATQEGYKTGALLKYNTSDGTLAWRKMLQGDVGLYTRSMIEGQVVVDSENNVHALLGFLKGTHLDGMVVVPDSFETQPQYYLVKFNSQGTVLSAALLPMEGQYLQPHTEFRYDENLQRYYLAGFRNYYGGGDLINLSYNGIPFTKTMYILALDMQGNELWRREENDSANINGASLHGMRIDSDSNIYICGAYFSTGSDTITFSNYTFPTTVSDNIVYLMKLDPQGNVLWGTTPDFESSLNIGFDIAVNGNEVALATEMYDNTWGTVSIGGNQGTLSNAVVVRFNKDTGIAFDIKEIQGQAGYKDAMTAIATDNDGNYITGGYFRYNLFTDHPNGIPTLGIVDGQTSYTDFFIAKLAASPCGTFAVKDFAKDTFRLYPNPTSGLINFETAQTMQSYEVVNLLGQKLIGGKLEPGEKSISIDALSQGTYILNFTATDGTVVSRKVVRM